MNFTRNKQSDRQLAIEMAPMIDVIFLLIIFFMATARFAQITYAEVTLPHEVGEQAEGADEAGLILNVLSDGTILLADERIEPGRIAGLVEDQANRQQRPRSDLKVMIRADRDAPTGALNRLISALRESGVGSARIATEVPR